MNKTLVLVYLHSIGITHKKLFHIYKNEENLENFFINLDSKKLEKLGYKSEQINEILNKKTNLKLDHIENIIKKLNVKIINYYDKEYPEQLKQIPNSPFLLYLRGNLPKKNCFSIVGARKITSYGQKVIEKIIPDLINNFCIVSGGAFGCDTKAHEVTLNSGGQTLVVVGTGIDLNYPVQNKKLYENIIESSGGIISIFPIGTPGSFYTFPVRNEIVAGLSVGTLIVEAEEKSGSLITGKLTLDLGKDLYAIPGDIFASMSVGCNKLISNGEAKLVRCSSDILEDYGFSKTKLKNKIQLIFNDETEENIYNLLCAGSLQVDDIVKFLGLEINLTNLKLSMMELAGIIKKSSNGIYEIS